eukprot:7952121-Ditylum_brightwellii.AAC.1
MKMILHWKIPDVYYLSNTMLAYNRKHDHSCTGNGSGLTTCGLQGSHLTPVFLKFGLEDLDLPEEAVLSP